MSSEFYSQLPYGWFEKLKEFRRSPEGLLLEAFVSSLSFEEIYPPKDKIFAAFKACPFDEVQVVILGQDPYHGEGQANGLAFSVPDELKTPPSLRNIFTELDSEYPHKGAKERSNDLSDWARQGVLLLNTVLTVEKGKAGSHQKKGWEKLSDEVIRLLSYEKENLVFILWGASAAKKEKMIDTSKHLILKSPHPSPLSSYRGFFGSYPFSHTNKYLKDRGKNPIKWI